jgi:phosphoglycolate phosphatase-like HAD superfamily hydrolase
MIGDGVPDLHIARAAGCASAAALWGYTPPSRLLAEGPTFPLERPEQLLAMLS